MRYRTKVSTTRGTPSTSIDLKEAVREKIPLHYDLLRKLRSQHGSTVISRITVDDIYEGLKGVNTLVRETSEVDPRFGVKYIARKTKYHLAKGSSGCEANEISFTPNTRNQ